MIDTLAELFAMRGVPKCVRSDDGPEFVAHAIRRWLAKVDVETLYIEPGSPWENGYAESFHSRLRDEFLTLEVFESLSATKRLTRQWREDYNHSRTAQLAGVRNPDRVRGPLCYFRSGFGYASACIQQHSEDYPTQPS